MMLDVRNATFSFRNNVRVLEDISFVLDEGDVFCILGPNGVGKSTLVRCLARLLALTGGHIILDGNDIREMNRQDLSKKIAFIPQIHSPGFAYSVLDFVLMGRSPYIGLFSSPSEEDFSIAEEAISTVRIASLKDKLYTQISGGEQQLVLFAQALAQEPRLLILDEPTSHLDLANQIYVLDLIDRLADEGLTTIMTTHIPDHALHLDQHAALMTRKTFFAKGPVKEVITEENMQLAYGINVKIVNVDEMGQKTCVPIKRRGNAHG